MNHKKIVEETRKKIAFWFYNTDYPQAYTPEEIERYEKDVDKIMSIVSPAFKEIEEETRKEFEGKVEMMGYVDNQGIIRLLDQEAIRHIVKMVQKELKGETHESEE